MDGDGYGSSNSSVEACTAPNLYVSNADDCNDLEPTAYDNAFETCDGIDNDCNGQIDEGVQNTYYLDADGDGYGTANYSVEACSAPNLYVSNTDDCNDLEPTAYDNAVETCDGVDNDCNGQIDEGVLNTYYLDLDGDGYGTVMTEACTSRVAMPLILVIVMMTVPMFIRVPMKFVMASTTTAVEALMKMTPYMIVPVISCITLMKMVMALAPILLAYSLVCLQVMTMYYSGKTVMTKTVTSHPTLSRNAITSTTTVMVSSMKTLSTLTVSTPLMITAEVAIPYVMMR